MNYLILVALLSDIFTPILIWKAGLPEEFRWISLVALAGVAFSGLLSVERQRRFPRVAWLILAVSVLGGLMGWLSGQGIAATAWGWYLMFKYPLVGLYAYHQPQWPERFPEKLRLWCLRLLWFEVGAQIVQYVTGEMPGDNLSGTLGTQGTAHLGLFVLLVLAVALGDWIASGKLRRLGIAVGLGLVSSILAELKLFYFALPAMFLPAMFIFLWRKKRMGRALLSAFIVIFVIYVFPMAYDTYVAPARGGTSFSNYLDLEQLNPYLEKVTLLSSGYDVGRDYAFAYVWGQISSSPVTLLFGRGLGARGTSKTLGSVGISLVQGDLGLFTGTSLVVVLGELGLFGLIILAAFISSVVAKLWKMARTEKNLDLVGIQYGLLIYTLLMPVWLWYTQFWILPVPMLLYWVTLGRVLGESRRRATIPEAVSGYVQPIQQNSWRQSR